MPKSNLARFAFTCLMFGVLVGPLTDQVVAQLSLQFKRITSSLSSPVFATHAPGDFDRLFVVQRGGQIRIVDLTTDTLLAANFVTVPGILSGGEQGLLGLAFHPNYASNGFFYVNFTDDTGGDTRIMRFSVTADPNVADPNSGVLLLEFDQPQSNHNGGWIGFGPDGYLYISTGDGGGANDSGSGHTSGTGNAQDITSNLLGKMLRLDVDQDDFPADPNRNYGIPASNPFVGIAGDDEIFLYGLRNPWRCSFDRETFDLYIGDVGQGAREEIDVHLFGESGNRNFGWRLREGTIETPASGIGGPPPADNVNPIYDYPRTGSFSGSCVVGGYVYRGPVADLRGHYFFSDHGSDPIWSIKYDQSPQASFDGANYNARTNWTSILTTTAGTIADVSSFAEDAVGNLYVCDIGGELYRLTGGNISTVVDPDSFALTNGIYTSGGLAELAISDDAYLVFTSGILQLGNPGEPQVWVEFEGATPGGIPEELILDLEVHATKAGLDQKVELYKFEIGDYEVVDLRNSTITDQAITIDPDGDGSEFVDVDGAIRLRLGWRNNQAGNRIRFRTYIDRLIWRVVE